MKLFIRDHLPLVIIHIIQLFLVLLIYWLDGYRNLPTAFYSIFLGMSILTGYLLYRYIRLRSFYNRLSNPMETLDESINKNGNALLAEQLNDLLKHQYRLYQQQMKLGEKKRDQHIAFMNLWVHQMKTPLSVIDLITQEEDDPRFRSIKEEADRMGKGIEMALYAARLDAFEQDFAVESVHLRKIIERVLQENKRLFIRNKVFPTVEISEHIIVESDAKWLAFILNQLITNAVKYTANLHHTITILAKLEEQEMILEVKDYGVGIPSSDINRVFQPFYTGENGRNFGESTGMGLYLTSEACKHLGHKIEVQSEVGQGTTVRIAFQSYILEDD
ncbi:sensor histidine kinase [Bacillus sp. 31A1R]|uniref:histidine kinase n=1 Tax=Robertmurraya mangrovi TaxID=3098077 RepID=A0ABU5J3X7_9BACI|nr:sensor histidine kinase [Bacillus sp. 31A1R]MDZ5474099.1 sensor histidine kinase [Bacillus sp. 31A1R]